MRRFYIVRHGQTDYNRRKLVQGWCDSSLSDVGIQQAQGAGALLKNVRFDLVVTGGQGRHIETANQILSCSAEKRLVSFRPFAGLREQCFGMYEAKPEADFKEAVKRLAVKDGWCDESVDFPAFMNTGKIPMETLINMTAAADYTHQCETYEKIRIRALDAMRQVLAVSSGRPEMNILMVSSGVLLAVLLFELTKDPVCAIHMAHGGVTCLEEEDGHYRLVRYNETVS